MGYTHYMYQSRTLTPEEWESFTTNCARIFAQTDVPLGGWDGCDDPVIDGERVEFNGRGADSHETCVVLREKHDPLYSYQGDNRNFSFTKTNRKPYDKVVVQVYALAKAIAPDAFDISSDGGDDAFPDDVEIH